MVDAAATVIYEPSPATGPLRQGEILSGLLEPIAASLPADADAPIPFDVVTHPFAVVLSQACDLERDFAAREAGDAAGELRSILLCEAFPEDVFRGQLAGSDIWRRAKKNKDERYMFLRAVAAEVDAIGQGFIALGLDFRRHFTLRPALVYQQLQATARRRAVLRDLYATHLSSRFAFYLSRVGLPVDHDS